jgi:hypothetical protein
VCIVQFKPPTHDFHANDRIGFYGIEVSVVFTGTGMVLSQHVNDYRVHNGNTVDACKNAGIRNTFHTAHQNRTLAWEKHGALVRDVELHVLSLQRTAGMRQNFARIGVNKPLDSALIFNLIGDVLVNRLCYTSV